LMQPIASRDRTGDDAAMVQLTGYGPSSTEYVDPSLDPRNPTKTE
jgi:hypothetical protein